MVSHFCFSYLSLRCQGATYPSSVLWPVALHRDHNMGAEVLHPHRQPVGVAQQGERGEMDITEESYFFFWPDCWNLVFICILICDIYRNGGVRMINYKYRHTSFYCASLIALGRYHILTICGFVASLWWASLLAPYLQ